MKESTRKMIEIARETMRMAYNNEIGMFDGQTPDWDSESAKKVGEVLQKMTDLLYNSAE